MQHLNIKDWDHNFKQTILLYKLLNKCPRQQYNIDGASIGFIWPPIIHSHYIKGTFAKQSIMEMNP